MVNNSNMISLTTKYEVKNLFLEAFQRTKSVILWQQVDNIVHRRSCISKIKRVDLNKDELILIPIKGTYDFNSQLPLYFYSKRKTLIFKNSIYFNEPFKLIVKFPQKIMITNLRASSRSVIDSKDGLYVKYHFGHTADEQAINMKSQLLDYSDNGLAFKSSLSNIIKFVKGDAIKIQSTNCKSKYLNGKINYVTMVLDPKDNQYFYRVGVKYI